jgi:hypothetical protein
MPPVGSEPHYRAKSAVDGRERALLEGQMRSVPAEPVAKVERASAAKPVVRHRGMARPASKRLAGSGGARRVTTPDDRPDCAPPTYRAVRSPGEQPSSEGGDGRHDRKVPYRDCPKSVALLALKNGIKGWFHEASDADQAQRAMEIGSVPRTSPLGPRAQHTSVSNYGDMWSSQQRSYRSRWSYHRASQPPWRRHEVKEVKR